MLEFKMGCGNDCGAYVRSLVDVAIWNKDDLELVWDEPLGLPAEERWINVTVEWVNTGTNSWEGEYRGTVENENSIERVARVDMDIFRVVLGDLAVKQADEVGMFNG